MKRMKIHTVLLAWCLCVSMAFAEVSHYDGVAAYVNDKVVTIETVLQQMRANFDLSKVGREALPGRIRELFPVVRDLIVDRMLILKAYEDSGAQLPNEAVNERIQTILAEDFEGNEARLRAVLRGQHMTYDAWVKQVREDMIVQAMRQLQVGKKTSVSPKRIRAYYAAHADDFAQAGRVHVRLILIPPEKGASVAEEALAALRGGEDFAAVAKRFSTDSRAEKGGDWGFVEPEKNFAPVVVAALKKLKPGEYSEILETSGYRSIVQKVEEQRGKRPTLTEAWPAVEAAVRNELGQERYKVWLEGLRKQAYIKVVNVKL